MEDNNKQVSTTTVASTVAPVVSNTGEEKQKKVIDELRKEVSSLKKDVSKSELSLSDERKKSSSLAKDVSALNKELSVLNNELVELKKELLDVATNDVHDCIVRGGKTYNYITFDSHNEAIDQIRKRNIPEHSLIVCQLEEKNK